MPARQVLTMFVPGIPIKQGDLRTGRHHRAYYANGDQLRPWKAAVTGCAYELWHDHAPLIEPVVLDVTFFLPRPASISAKKRPLPVVAPDLDKLVRSIGDALTGVVIRDDALIVDLLAAKRYAERHACGARITLGVYDDAARSARPTQWAS